MVLGMNKLEKELVIAQMLLRKRENFLKFMDSA